MASAASPQAVAGSRGGQLAWLVAVATLWVVFALVSRELPLFGGSASVVWLPSGLALAAVLLGGPRFAIAVFAGAFIFAIFTGLPLAMALVNAMAKALAPLTAASLLRSSGRFNHRLASPADYARLVAAGAAGALVNASVGAIMMAAEGMTGPGGLPGIAISWWLGDVLGIVLVNPTLLIWSQPPRRVLSGWRAVEAVVFFLVTTLTGQVLFAGWHAAELLGHSRFGYPTFAFVLWAATRFGIHGVVLTVGLTTVQALYGASASVGFFANQPPHLMWLFLSVLAASGTGVALVISERNRSVDRLSLAEQQRHQSEQFTVATLDSISSHVCVLDGSGTIMAVNRAWRDFYDQNHAAPHPTYGVGSNYLLVCEQTTGTHREPALQIAEGIRQVSRGERDRFVSEYPCHGPAGQRWFLLHVTPFHDASGHVVLAHADITQSKLAGEALRRSAQLLEQSQRIAKVGGWEFDIPTQQLYWTAETYRLHDTSPDEFTPTVAAGVSYFLPESRRLISAALDTAMTRGEDYDLELETHTTKGRLITVRTTCAVTMVDGRAVKLTGSFQDITTHKQAEMALRDSEARESGVINAAMDGIISIDEAQRIVMFNAAAGAMFRLAPAEAIGQTIERFIPECFRDEHTKWVRAFATEATTSTRAMGQARRVSALRSTGEEFPIEASISRIETRQGTLLTVIMRDVSQQLDIEDQLRQAQKMEAIGQLTGGVAHDFNNVLAVILGNLGFVEEALADRTDLRRKVQGAILAGERGAMLTRSLLAFSRQQPLDSRVIDARAVIRDLLDMVRHTLPENITVTCAEVGHWPCRADPGQLQNALLNLVVNARDAMPNGGELFVDVSDVVLDAAYTATQAEVTPGEYVRLTVRDTGTGMPPDVLSRVFDPFFTTKEFGRGNGLGLSMVFGFAKQSGGHVAAASTPGHGTVVTLYLPRGAGAIDLATAAPETLRAGSGETVLVVEDDTDVRELTAAMLDALGYVTVQANNADEALQSLRQLPTINLLLTDMTMPGHLNGRELAAAAARLRPDLRVVYMSGYPEGASLDAERTDRGEEFLQKPFSRIELAIAVRQVLDATSRGEA